MTAYICNECKDKKTPCRIEIPYYGDSMEDKTLCVLNGQTGEGRFEEVVVE